MVRIAVLLTIATVSLVAAGASPAAAAPPERPNVAAPGAALTDLSAQSRPRARIRVTPRSRYGTRSYPRALDNSPYPRPYNIDYPGPNARRECTARYVQEMRPSGTVIVPRMNCWWVRG